MSVKKKPTEKRAGSRAEKTSPKTHHPQGEPGTTPGSQEKILEALKVSELRYRRLFEAAQDGILLLNADSGQVEDVNLYLLKLLGYSHEQFLEKKIWEIGPLKDIAASKEAFRVLQEKEYIRYEDLPLETSDGRIIHVEFVSNVYQVDHTRVIQCNIRDITGRAETEEDLRRTRSLIANAFKNSPLLMTVSDLATGKYLEVNDSFCQVSGFSRQEAVGKTSVELGWISPQDRTRMVEELTRNGNVTGLELGLRSKSGKTIVCRYAGEIIHSVNGDRLFSTADDITQAKLAQEKLVESEEKHRRLFETMSQGVLYCDATGKIILANPSAERILGLTRDQLIGKTVHHPEWKVFRADGSRLPVKEHPVPTALRTGKPVTGIVIRMVDPLRKESHWLSITAIPIFLPGQGKPCQVYSTFEDITERRQVEAALEEETARRRMLFEQSPDGILMIDSKTSRFLDFNTAAHQQLGYTREEFSHLSIVDIEARETAEETRKQIEKVQQDGRSDFETLQRTRQGEIRNVHVIAQCIMDRGRQVYMCTWRDITERKEMEEALRASEARYHAIYEQAGDGVIILDTQGKILSVNEKFAHLHGYTMQELIEMGLENLDVAGGTENFPDRMQRLLAGETITFEVEHHHKDGHTFPLAVTSSQINVGIEQIIIAIHRDITERKRDEEQIRRMALMLDTAPNSITVHDFDGHFFYANQKTLDLHGYTLQEFMALNLHQLDAPESETLIAPHMRELLEKGETTFDVNHLHKDGSLLPMEVSARVTTWDKKKVILSVARDITERRQAVEKLLASEKNLQEAQRLAHIGSWHWTVAADKVSWSQELYRINQRDPDLPAPGFAEMASFYTPESWERLNAAVTRALQAGEPYDLELDLVRPDGTIRHTVSQGEIDYDLGGRVVGLHGTVQDITERKQVEERLSIILKAVDAASDAIGISDARGHHFYHNQAFARLFGYATAEELETRGGGPAVVKDPQVAQEMFASIMGGDSWEGELEMITRDERVFPAFERADAIKDHDGRVIGLIGVITDISARRQAEQAIRQSEERFRSILDNIEDGYFEVDTRGNLTFFNPAHARILGRSAEELMGMNNRQYMTPEAAKTVFQAFNRVLNTGMPEQAVGFELIRPDGTHRLVECSVSLIKDAGGSISGFRGTLRDISERKQAQTLQNAVYRIATAAETTASLDELYAQIHQVISSVMPAESFYITLYDESQNLLQFPYFRDAEDEPFVGGVPPAHGLTAYVLRTGKSLLCTQAVHDELERQGEVKLLGVPSAIWLGVPLVVEGKTIGAMVVQHYTDPNAYSEREQHMLEFVSTQIAIAISRKQAEEEILRLNASLEQRVEERTRELHAAQEKLVRQEKLAVLGQLAGSVGHELRNPLGVINTSIYYLNMVLPEADEKVKQHLSIIKQEVFTADKIIGDLLDFARVKSTDRQNFPVDLLVRQTLERFHVPPALEFKLDLPDDLPDVFADSRQMEQVLGNLVTNACQAMTVQNSATGLMAGASLCISARAQDDLVAIAVQDTGPGINSENMKKLFEPLFTTKARGIGLGLAVSRKLAEANGGRIEVESEPGKGSTFTLYLPVGGKA